MERKKLIIVIIVILFVLAGGTALFSPKYVQSPAAFPAAFDTVRATRSFKDGVHTISGKVSLPTPCHELAVDALVAESFPEQVTINFTAKNPSQECVQVITETSFDLRVKASQEAQFSAKVNGVPVRLELIKDREFQDAAGDAVDTSSLADEMQGV